MGVRKLLSCVLVLFFVLLKDGRVDLEVEIPTITKGGYAVEDVVGTSFRVIREEVAVEEALVVVPCDVALSQSHLRRSWDGEPNDGFGCHVCPYMERQVPNQIGPHDAPT